MPNTTADIDRLADADSDRKLAAHLREQEDHDSLVDFAERWTDEIKSGASDLEHFIDALMETKAPERQELFDSLRRGWRFDPHTELARQIDSAVRDYAFKHARAEAERRRKEAMEP